MSLADKFWNQKNARLRYSIVWFAFACLRVLVRFPLGLQLALGRCVGKIARRIIPSRRRVVEKNLAACFPQMTQKQRLSIERDHFAALGMSFAEMAMGWYGSVEKIKQRVSIHGLEHLEDAQANGKGVILLSAHFTSFEFFFPALAPHCGRLAGMYKQQRNPAMNEIMTAGRGRNFDHLFAKDNVRDMIRELRHNAVVWYASDQSYAGSHSTLLPFFGVPAMTNTAISRIAQLTGATVLPYFCRRLAGNPLRYEATIGSPIANFPSNDPKADALAFTTLLEQYILECPEQYWWIHQRFKGRPDYLPNLYGKAHD